MTTAKLLFWKYKQAVSNEYEYINHYIRGHVEYRKNVVSGHTFRKRKWLAEWTVAGSSKWKSHLANYQRDSNLQDSFTVYLDKNLKFTNIKKCFVHLVW